MPRLSSGILWISSRPYGIESQASGCSSESAAVSRSGVQGHGKLVHQHLFSGCVDEVVQKTSHHVAPLHAHRRTVTRCDVGRSGWRAR